QQPAGRLPDPRRTRAGAGHRADVGLRQRDGRRGVLQGHHDQVQLPGQPRPRGSSQAVRTFAAAAVRRGRADPLTDPPDAQAPPAHPDNSRRYPMFKKLVLTVALASASTLAFAEPVTYKLDPAHTDVIAQWSHFGFSNPSAHFGDADGTLVYDVDNVAASS